MNTLSVPFWSQYYKITKPKVVFLIVFTAMVGMLLAADGTVPLKIFVFGLLGISAGGLIGSIITATAGAALLLFIVGIIKKA